MINREGRRRKCINDAVLLTVYCYCCAVVLLSARGQRTALISEILLKSFHNFLNLVRIDENLTKTSEWKFLSNKFSHSLNKFLFFFSKFPSTILFATSSFLCKKFSFSRKTSIEFSTWAKSFWDRIFRRPILLSSTSCLFSLEMITETRWNCEMGAGRDGIIW